MNRILNIQVINENPAMKRLRVDGEQFDATALTGFIEKGVKIIVVGYQTGQLVVKKK